MPYLCIGIELRQDLEPERVEKSCLDAGALSITLTDTRDDPVLEPAVGEIRLWPETRLHALFAADAAAAPLVTTLSGALGLAPDRFEISVLEDRVWEREWLKDFHAMRFGERLWIAPTHEPVTDPEAVVIALDPGLAFGTGSHASTALCLSWLDGHAPRGASVIDYGSGSGVLAIAAVKLGAANAACWDLDPQACTATRENAERNGISDRVIVARSEAALPLGVDLLLANILAAPLRALAARFAELVRPGGQLVLAGLLEADAAEVTAAYASWFDISSFGAREGWIGLAGVRVVHDLP